MKKRYIILGLATLLIAMNWNNAEESVKEKELEEKKEQEEKLKGEIKWMSKIHEKSYFTAFVEDDVVMYYPVVMHFYEDVYDARAGMASSEDWEDAVVNYFSKIVKESNETLKGEYTHSIIDPETKEIFLILNQDGKVLIDNVIKK